ncbi:RES family NAD+ phosphorylase [Luteimonas sp. MJ246]|uniref:RES family NAD+ phosphorylase n=1 Tax=Luteimonas TaxID=83614 RepID=UPI0031BB48BF
MQAPKTTRVRFRPAYRVVSSRFPPVGVFDAIADPADIAALHELESMTNPRMRDELGAIELVPPKRRIAGPGTTPIMASFTHLNPEGSRFTPGWFGAYYCAREQQTAVTETVFHKSRFLRATREPACVLDMRCYLGDVDGRFHDVRGGYPDLHDPDSYAASQRFAVELREADSNGIVYDSVRAPGGTCLAAFHPDMLKPVRQGPHLQYHWDGERIARVTEARIVPFQPRPRPPRAGASPR